MNSRLGSPNYEAALSSGYVEGEARYAPMEPHHAPGGAYTTMHHAASERLLCLILNGEYATNEREDRAQGGEQVSGLMLYERFAMMSHSPEDDYYAAECAGRVKTLLGQNTGSDYRQHDITAQLTSGVVEFFSMGWDMVEQDGDEWEAVYYSETLTRVAK